MEEHHEKVLLVLSLTVVFFCVSSGQARAAQEWTGDINFTLGAKVLDVGGGHAGLLQGHHW